MPPPRELRVPRPRSRRAPAPPARDARRARRPPRAPAAPGRPLPAPVGRVRGAVGQLRPPPPLPVRCPGVACPTGRGVCPLPVAPGSSPGGWPGVPSPCPAPWVPKGKAWLGLRVLPGQACPLCVATECPVQPPLFPWVPCTATLLLPWESQRSIAPSCSGHPWVPVRRRLLLAPKRLPFSRAPSCKVAEPWAQPDQLLTDTSLELCRGQAGVLVGP